MDNLNIKRISLSGILLVLAALFSLALTSPGTIATSVADLEQKTHGEKVVADDTLTLSEVREMIVGTWAEDVAQKVGNHKLGSLRWVFTEGGTVRKYKDGELYETESYALVGEYKGKQAPEDIAGYLKFIEQDGDVQHMTLTSIGRGPERPHLYVKTHGMAGNTETLFFVPARVFE